jgi:radical SAM superfamily enzyme YgiQ (UPF0313 family)
MQIKTKEDTSLLFVNPCLRRGSFTKILPVGLACVMTYFRHKGYNFDLLDIDINEYDDLYVENYVKENYYDFVLLGSIVTHYKWVKWFVNTVKKYHPDTKVIVGNSVGGSIPDVFLKHAKADAVVIGEGEITAVELVDAFRLGKDLNQVEGIAFMDQNNKFVRTPARKVGRIDDLPIVDWDFFDVQRYLANPPDFVDPDEQEKNIRAMPITTARGCAFRCTFCHFVFWNDPYRNRSPHLILQEIKRNIEKYNVKYFNFWDDLSFASAKQVSKMVDAILESSLKFKWSAAIRADLFSRNHLSREESIQVAKKMKKSGCFSVGFSLESGNQEILEMMNKKIAVNEFYDTVQILREAEIICNTSVVFGYPIETKETIRQTFEQCLKAGVYPSIGFLLPLPSTVMWDYAKANGFIKDEDAFLDAITERQDICLNMTKLSDEEIMTEIKQGAKKLNELLQLGLTEETYIRTKRYQNYKSHKKLTKKFPLDPDNIKRNENDFNFNYSAQEFVYTGQVPKTSN